MAESSLARMPMAARFGISAGLLLLGGLAYYVLFYSDIAGQIEQTKNSRVGLERDLVAAKKAEKAYQQDLEELARRRERERELNKILPATTESAAFLSAVQSIANSTGVQLSSWTPQPERQEKYYARVPMHITLDGRFHQIAKFFYGVGQNDRIMNMENIAITQPVVRDQEVYVHVEGLVTAFRAIEASTEQKPKR